MKLKKKNKKLTKCIDMYDILFSTHISFPCKTW